MRFKQYDEVKYCGEHCIIVFYENDDRHFILEYKYNCGKGWSKDYLIPSDYISQGSNMYWSVTQSETITLITSKSTSTDYIIELNDSMIGKRISCIIEGDIINEAKIQKEDGNYYICQDLKEGSNCKDKLGYKYSWIVDKGSKENLAQYTVRVTKILLLDQPTIKSINIIKEVVNTVKEYLIPQQEEKVIIKINKKRSIIKINQNE